MAKRRERGGGSVFYSESKKCWVWKAVTGLTAGGAVTYTQGRARTQAAALKKKQDAERSARQPNADKETVGEHLDHWLQDVAKPNTMPATWARYEQCVRLHLKPHVGGVPLKKLTVSRVVKLWADLGRDGMSGGNVKKCSEVLATALEQAVAEEKIAVAPTRKAAKPRVRRAEVEVFTDDEVRAIIGAAEGHRLEALFLSAVGTGMREGELFALTPGDFDLAAGTVRVTKSLDRQKGKWVINPTKSRSGVRTITLPSFAVESVKRHPTAVKPGAVFTSRSGGYLVRSNFVRRDWTGLLTRAKVRYRKFHTLRHTHASRLLADGVDPAEVARRLGDRIETVMRVYAHWIPTANRDTAARVDAIYAKKIPAGGQGGGKVAGGEREDTSEK